MSIPTTQQQLECISQLTRHQLVESNIAHAGGPIIRVVDICTLLVLKRVEVDKVSRQVSHY